VQHNEELVEEVWVKKEEEKEAQWEEAQCMEEEEE
jgi:hypothetical protein